ncbi:MAG: MFS transporter [Novosphingobium sp.]|nr:MFS transporter [Novosphingobium sp.]
MTVAVVSSIRKERFQTWIVSAGILLTAAIGSAVAGAHVHVVGAMVDPLNDAFGWSRGDITLALAMGSVVHAVTNIAVGALTDRYGPRRILVPGIALYAIGCALLGLAGPQLWTWYAAYLAFTILSSGASSIAWTVIVIQRFDRNRGLALAASLAGPGAVVSLMPTIVVGLVEHFGVRGVYPTLALGAFVLMIVPTWLFVPKTMQSAIPAKPRQPPRKWWLTLASRKVWQLAAALGLVAACIGTLLVHFQAMLIDAGLRPGEAASVALVTGPALVVGRLLTGFLYDRLPPLAVTVGAFCLPAIAAIWILAVPIGFGSAHWLAILIGLGIGCEVDVAAYLSSRYFDTADYGKIYGLVITVYSVSVAAASWLAGLAFDRTGSYAPALGAFAVGIAVAIALVTFLGQPPPSTRPRR